MTTGLPFFLTGDIPAMWLRDSTAQMRPYCISTKKMKKFVILIVGLVKKQMIYINLDPYANAFQRK